MEIQINREVGYMRVLSLDSFCESTKSYEIYMAGNSGDNSRQNAVLKRVLHRVIDNELTHRQKEIVSLYYFHNKNILEISKDLGINKSTVSRHLSRARERIKRVLRYGYFPVWKEVG